MAAADYTVLTPERVSLQYGIAGIGSRGGAAVVDTLIQSLLVGVISAGLVGAAVALGTGARGFGVLVIGVWTLALLLISSGYFMIFEILWNGQTPGKRLLGLRVIRESGYPIRPVDAVIRNLVRLVDWLPIGYGVGVLVMLVNRRARRLGDFAGGTIVVREGGRRALPSTAVVEQEIASGPPVALASADATLVRDFLVRREGMHPSARAELAQRLATALAHRYQLPLEAADAERFLETLAG